MSIVAPIALSATGTIVAAVTGRKIRVRAFLLSFSGTVNAKLQSSTGPADLSGLIYGILGTVAPSPVLPQAAGPQSQAPFHFDAAAGDALLLNLSAGVAVGGWIVYDLVQPSM